jgi:hypothetical protein
MLKQPKNTEKWNHRIFIGTPTTGNIRMEWATARYGQTIPTCWSSIDHNAWMAPYAPSEYSVPDAQNLIVKAAVDAKAEWLFLLEHDNVIPPDTFLRLNQYMLKGDVPVVSGLYFTKSVPPEPLLYRGRGKGHFTDWKLGEKVWVDGVPTGVLLLSMDLVKAVWDESEEYDLGGIKTRRVFDIPSERYYDPQTLAVHQTTGTSDLNFCSRVMKEGFFRKAGFPKYQTMKYPFLVDTKIFSTHIDNNGKQYPLSLPKAFIDGKMTWQKALHTWD